MRFNNVFPSSLRRGNAWNLDLERCPHKVGYWAVELTHSRGERRSSRALHTDIGAV
jgi:hypothetical protein